MNGSFEVIKSGLPVNWHIYTQETIPEAEYDLVIDTIEYKEGKKSLKFSVQECSDIGGSGSPGLFNEYEAIPGETYKISFWIKNDGCDFIILVGGVSAFEGEEKTIIRSKEKIDKWKYVEYQYKNPIKEKYERIRFELSIQHPGVFWIDDVNILESDGKSVVLADNKCK